jgi:hypothetical protein
MEVQMTPNRSRCDDAPAGARQIGLLGRRGKLTAKAAAEIVALDVIKAANGAPI